MSPDVSASAWFYLSLFGLGALDSLEPGHGKALVLGFFTSRDARLWHLVLLALVVTLTHLVMNGCLAAIILYLAAPVLANHQIFQMIQLISGLGVLGFAVVMTVARFRVPVGAGGVGLLRGGPHEQGPNGWRSLLWLGGLSGLAPCPVVLTALVTAVMTGHQGQAWQSMGVFSLGYGAVIVLTGGLALMGLNLMDGRSPRSRVVVGWLSRCSALVALVLGLLIVLKTLWFYTPEPSPAVEGGAAPLLFVPPR